jgi:hypothetical protein
MAHSSVLVAPSPLPTTTAVIFGLAFVVLLRNLKRG